VIKSPQFHSDRFSTTRRLLRGGSAAVLSLSSAEDIGALPDRSVSEALQRVPGVSVLRFAGPDDPDHFSVEGSGVTIRGLPFVRSELNGRDVFGAGPSGRLGFEDVSPELLGSVVVSKNQSADMIEGGLSGTVDLRTRLPFDNDDSVFAYSLDLTYSDFIDRVTPSFSALYSNRWETGAGEFGLLGAVSKNTLDSRSDATQISDYRARNVDGTLVDPADVNETTLFGPTGGGVRTQEFDRERDAIALAGQWASNDGRWEATAQFLQSDSGTAWTENVLESSIDDAPNVRYRGVGDVEPTADIFGDDRLFQAGLVTGFQGWRGNDLASEDGSLFDDVDDVFQIPAGGIRQLALARERVENDVTRDFGFNLKFTPTDRLRTQFDVQYIEASADVTDVTVHTGFYSDLEIILDGADTQINYIEPEIFDSPVDFGEGGTVLDGPLAFEQNGPFFDNSANYFLRSKMDHITDSEADSLALRGDVEYDIDKGWLDSVRVGARYAERDSLLQESTFNWGNISEWWTGTSPTGDGENQLRLNNPIVNGLAGPNNFANFQRNGTSNNFPGLFWQGPLASNYDLFLETIQPLLEATGAEGRGGFTLANRNGAIAGTPFIPSEINRIQTENYAAYARLDFGNEESPFSNGMSIDGNIGVRYVKTDVRADSNFSVADISQTPLNPNNTGILCEQNGDDLRPSICGLPAAQFANLQQFFGDRTTQDISSDNSYERILPSLNLKLQLNEEMLIRFGAARSMSRPDENQLRIGSEVNIGADLPIADPNNPQFRTFTGLQTFSGNPLLRPTMSNQLDLSYEWYFGDSNSLTIAGFYKELEDSIIPTVTVGGSATGGVFNEGTITSNGATEVVTFNQPDNSNINVEFKGFEVAYQHFYDFLPGPLSNLGVQANYTYIDASSPGEFDNSVTGNTADGNEPLQRDGSNFEQVSKHQFNVAGIYEDDKISARLAYNWRDDFLLVRRDVIFPFSSIFQKATGQLDGSVFYTVNDNFRVGITGVNLLDDVTETEQLINGTVPSGLNVRAPRSFIRNDRRFTLSLRANF